MFPIVFINCFIDRLLEVLIKLNVFPHNVVSDSLPVIPVNWSTGLVRELHMLLHIEEAVNRSVEEAHPPFDPVVWHY